MGSGVGGLGGLGDWKLNIKDEGVEKIGDGIKDEGMKIGGRGGGEGNRLNNGKKLGWIGVWDHNAGEGFGRVFLAGKGKGREGLCLGNG